ncbi:MAG: hypothetical protein M9962_14035 [Oligoflexia bacterium]|nr:hypothetical protein [Oligoflexia bacterium]
MGEGMSDKELKRFLQQNSQPPLAKDNEAEKIFARIQLDSTNTKQPIYLQPWSVGLSFAAAAVFVFVLMGGEFTNNINTVDSEPTVNSESVVEIFSVDNFYTQDEIGEEYLQLAGLE